MTGDDQARQEKIDYLLQEIIRRYPAWKFGDIAETLLRPDNPEAATFAGLTRTDLVLRLGQLAK